MKNNLDDPVARVKKEYRDQAHDGRFKAYPAFEKMCMSGAGYEPLHGIAALPEMTRDSFAAEQVAKAQSFIKIWHAPLKPESTTTPEPLRVIVREGSDPTTFCDACKKLLMTGVEEITLDKSHPWYEANREALDAAHERFIAYKKRTPAVGW